MAVPCASCDLHDVADIDGHDRQVAGHRLLHRIRGTLRARGEEEDIGSVEPQRHLGWQDALGNDQLEGG